MADFLHSTPSHFHIQWYVSKYFYRMLYFTILHEKNMKREIEWQMLASFSVILEYEIRVLPMCLFAIHCFRCFSPPSAAFLAHNEFN